VYYLALVTLVLMALAAIGLRRSRSGRALLATRDNEQAAAAYGINIVRAKITAFAVSGFIAAVAGSVFVFHQASFRADSFFTGESLGVFIATVIGGVGTLWGAILGAVFLRGSQWLLPGNWALLATGAGSLFVLMVVPDGLGGILFRVRDRWLRWIAERRGIAVPSLRGNQGDALEPEPEMEEAA